VVSHNPVNRLAINNGYARIESTDCIAHCSNPAFDASTFEVWGALLNGARVLIVPQSVLLDAARFVEFLQRQSVTVLWITVGLFSQYVDALMPVYGQLRYLVTGGDVVDPSIVRRVIQHGAPEHLLNAYGPTECTTFSTTYRIERLEEGGRSLSIGKPIANAQIYILDTRQRPVPVGVAGQIYIGGAGIALGYLNRPELTAERFVPDPFGSRVGARLYNSGDVGRWRSDGTIEFLGRGDQQVKLRGFRVELGEIEACLARHVGVRDAIVIVRGDSGEKYLVAYYTREEGEDPSVETLRNHLKSTLPEFMIPSAFVRLQSLPLTANGKPDRKGLPAPELSAYASKQYEAPQGELEQALADIWSDLLKVERVGRSDNFFELGGHSLQATKLVARIAEQLAAELSVVTIFKGPTIEQLAQAVLSARGVEFEEGFI